MRLLRASMNKGAIRRCLRRTDRRFVNGLLSPLAVAPTAKVATRGCPH